MSNFEISWEQVAKLLQCWHVNFTGMRDGEDEKPVTRNDLRRLIEQFYRIIFDGQEVDE